jgi:hypothetical protein
MAISLLDTIWRGEGGKKEFQNVENSVKRL